MPAAAVAVAKNVYAESKIGPDQLPAASLPLLPTDEAAEAQRAAAVSKQFGATAPGVVQYTSDILFRDLWLRPDPAPRDRSLVTVGALIASGQIAQLASHLNRAMNNGVTLATAFFSPTATRGGATSRIGLDADRVLRTSR